MFLINLAWGYKYFGDLFYSTRTWAWVFLCIGLSAILSMNTCSSLSTSFNNLPTMASATSLWESILPWSWRLSINEFIGLWAKMFKISSNKVSCYDSFAVDDYSRRRVTKSGESKRGGSKGSLHEGEINSFLNNSYLSGIDCALCIWILIISINNNNLSFCYTNGWKWK